MKLSIIGSGAWGTTLGILAAKNGHEVIVYDRNGMRASRIDATRENLEFLPGIKLPTGIKFTGDLKATLVSPELILVVVPSKVFRQTIKEIAPFIKRGQFLVHGTKGLESNSSGKSMHVTMTDILSELLPASPNGAISGPNLARELAHGLPGATVVASKDRKLIEQTQKALTSNQLRVYATENVREVEWAGTLKNVIAIAAGIIQELELGQNAFALLVSRGLMEMTKVFRELKLQTTSLYGLAGVGDLIATCTSTGSRNFHAGSLLARGLTAEKIEKETRGTVEGLNTLKTLKEVGYLDKLDLPIATTLYQVAFENKDLRAAIQNLMARPARFEEVELA